MKFVKRLFASCAAAALVACGGGGSSVSTTNPSQTGLVGSTNGAGSAVVPSNPKMVILSAGSAEYGGLKTIQTVNVVAADSSVTLPTTSAGTVSATPVNQVVHLNRTPGGFYYGGSDAGGTYLIDPAQIDKICASSFQVGYSFLLGQHSRACAAPNLTSDTVSLPGTCSRDSVLYTFHMKDGSIYWFDWTSERKFTIAADSTLPGAVAADGGHINWNSFVGATIKAVKTGSGKASVTIDFGSNCLGSFGQMDDPQGKSGHLVEISVPTDGSAWFMFLWNSDKAGINGGSGWGSKPWVDATNNYTVSPSVVNAYLGFDKASGNYFVTIPNVPCNDAGNITVYHGTKQVDGSYVYDSGTTGSDPLGRPFGLGWLPIQSNASEAQLYTLLQDPSVTTTLDRQKFQIVIGSCG